MFISIAGKIWGKIQFCGTSLVVSFWRSHCRCHFQGTETKVRERSSTRRFTEGIWKVGFWVTGEVEGIDDTYRG